MIYNYHKDKERLIIDVTNDRGIVEDEDDFCLICGQTTANGHCVCQDCIREHNKAIYPHLDPDMFL